MRRTFVEPPCLVAGLERNFGVDNVLRAVGITRPAIRCGRYELVEKLGEGSMGVVYRAHDPELDRAVAIKLLREAADEDARCRLRREAHALARLSDPRVVTVLSVGEDGGQIWIAMELVKGQTLAAWAQSNRADLPYRRSRGLELLREAGMGLAAAHRAGLVHRDFKPTNVLIGDDGQVKVADFGLAKLSERSPTHPEDGADRGERATLDATAMAGTPLYMAPEQHMGLTADARSDQFAFAVSAWEILGGAAPFRGRTLVELGEVKLQGSVEHDAALPAHVRRALMRAMSPDPHDRFVDMVALLDALERRRPYRLWMLGLAGATLVATVAWMTHRGSPSHPCGRLEVPTWNGARRAALQASFTRNGTLLAPEAWASLESAIDGYAGQWARTRDIACTSATAETGSTIAACLDRAARDFDRVVAFASSDPALALRGKRMIDELPSLDCASRARPTSAAHRELEDGLAEAALLRAARQTDDELALLVRLEPIARRLGDASLLGRVLRGLADAQFRRELTDAALHAIDEAYALAVEVGDDTAAMERGLVAVEILFERGDATGIRRWLDQVSVAHERLGRPASTQAVWRLIFEIQLATMLESRYDRVLELAREALTVLDGVDRASSLEISSARAAVHAQLFEFHMHLGNVDEAERHARLVIDCTAKQLGSDHPSTRSSYSALSDVLVARRRYEEAREAITRALEGERALLGGDSLGVAQTLVKSSGVHRLLGELETGREHAREALRILEAAGASPSLIADALGPLSLVQQASKDFVAARATGERIVALVEAELGPTHLSLAPAFYNLGEVLLEAEQHEEAEAHYRRSLEIAEATLGPDVPNLAYPLSGLGEVALLSGRREAAEAHLRRASRLAADHPDPSVMPRIWWSQARVIFARDPEHARSLAQRALEGYRDAGRHERADAVEAWLAVGGARNDRR